MGTTDRKVRPRYRGMSMISSGTRVIHAPIKCTVEHRRREACVNVAEERCFITGCQMLRHVLELRYMSRNLLTFNRTAHLVYICLRLSVESELL